jgi:hypothetical protein
LFLEESWFGLYSSHYVTKHFSIRLVKFDSNFNEIVDELIYQIIVVFMRYTMERKSGNILAPSLPVFPQIAFKNSFSIFLSPKASQLKNSLLLTRRNIINLTEGAGGPGPAVQRYTPPHGMDPKKLNTSGMF